MDKQRFSNKLHQVLFSSNEQQAFLEDLCELIDDGVPASKALEAIAQIGSGNSQKAAEAIMEKISAGQQLADGMVGWFPDAVIEIIRAGEEGGTLSENISAAARSLTQHTAVLTTLAASLVYPIVVLILGMGVSVFVKESVFTSFIHIISYFN